VIVVSAQGTFRNTTIGPFLFLNNLVFNGHYQQNILKYNQLLKYQNKNISKIKSHG